jgi:hypothetical protein
LALKKSLLKCREYLKQQLEDIAGIRQSLNDFKQSMICTSHVISQKAIVEVAQVKDQLLDTHSTALDLESSLEEAKKVIDEKDEQLLQLNVRTVSFRIRFYDFTQIGEHIGSN